MLPALTVNLIDANDWKGLYVNGKLKYQGHDIPTFIWLDILRGDQIFLDEYEGAHERLESEGEFPQTFKEVRERYDI